MAHWLYSPSKESWIITKNAAFCHNVRVYLPQEATNASKHLTVKSEGWNGMILELALLVVVMQGIEVLGHWRSGRGRT